MNNNRNKKYQHEVIGLIPAGGRATRIAPIPCSKELYPIGFQPTNEDGGVRPKVACHYLLEKMQHAGISKAYLILREGKWDIPAYFQDGGMLGMDLAYLIMDLPFGAPYTIDQAYPFVEDALVALGFPDILFSSDDAFSQLLNQQADSNADVVLGLFPADQPQKVDMVDLDNNGRVQQIVIKPRQTDLKYTWGIAVWTPRFTRFLHDYVSTAAASAKENPELYVGNVIQAAIDSGFRTEAVHISNEPFLDIGTPEDLARAVRIFSK